MQNLELQKRKQMNDENDKKEPDVTARPLPEGQPTAAGEHISVTEPLMETEMTEEVLQASFSEEDGRPQTGSAGRRKKKEEEKKGRSQGHVLSGNDEVFITCFGRKIGHIQ